MKKRTKLICVIIAAALLLPGVFSLASYAVTDTATTRTIMFYVVGSNLEEDYGSASVSILSILSAEYDENVSIICMTGGTLEWQMSSELLVGTDHIDADYNQIYKLEGRKGDEEYGRMTLLEEKGIPGAETTDMGKPGTLKAFLDYCYVNYPADLYDIILWDHGGGPTYGFGDDNHFPEGTMMRLYQMVEAFKNCELIKNGEDFESINFDACLMGNTDILAAFSMFTDCFIGSPESIPCDGEDYAGWLNMIKEYPNEMTGYDIGFYVVCNSLENYEERGNKATFSVYDLSNFRDRLLAPLMTLDRLMLKEATTKGEINGKYNFYDEIYSVNSSYEYDKTTGFSLFDLGNFVGALSAPQSEFDNLTLEDIEALNNVYTDTALEILEILDDWDFDGDDVLFGDWTSATYMMTTASFVRDLDGSLKRKEDDLFVTYPTGMSIFASNGNAGDAAKYVGYMKNLIDVLEDEELIEYYKGRIASVACYAAICLCGKTVSMLADTTDEPVTFDGVLEALKKIKRTSKVTYYDDMVKLLTHLAEFGGFEDYDAVLSYMEEITAQQYDEVVLKDEITAKRIYSDDGEVRYKIDINGMSAQSLMYVTAAKNAELINNVSDTLFDLLYYIYEENSIETLYPDGFSLISCSANGKLMTYEFTRSLDVTYPQMYQRVYASKKTTWILSGTESTAIVMYDSEGVAHITLPAFLDESCMSAVINISLMTSDGKFNDGSIYIECIDGEWKPVGLIMTEDDSISERSYTPFDSDFFDGAIFASAMLMTDYPYEYTAVIPISQYCAVDLTKENWGISFAAVDASTVTDIREGELKQFISDLYGYETDISDVLAAADAAAENGVWAYDINDAEIDMDLPVADGTPKEPKPTVTYNGKTLTEGVDYGLFYDGSSGPGVAHLMVYGMGDFCEGFMVAYTIACGEHTVPEDADITPATCTEDGLRKYECPECGLEVEEVIPATGHKLIRTPAKQPTADEDGNIEYFTCETCGKIFSDKDGKNEISLDDTVLPATGHNDNDNPNTADGAAAAAIVIMAASAVSLAILTKRKLRIKN